MIALVLEGVGERFKREHNERAWLAWHTAQLGRVAKFPEFKTLLHQTAKPKARRQSMAEQISVAMAWTAALGRKR